MTASIASQPGFGFQGALLVRAHEPAATLEALRAKRCVVDEATEGSLDRFLQAAVDTVADGLSFFESVRLSGSHRQSVEMVAGYEADVAAIDSSTLTHLWRVYPSLLEKVRVLCFTRD